MRAISTKCERSSPESALNIIATAFGISGSVTIPFLNYETSTENHCRAAKELCKKLDWHGELTGLHTPEGMVFVFTERSPRFKV